MKNLANLPQGRNKKSSLPYERFFRFKFVGGKGKLTLLNFEAHFDKKLVSLISRSPNLQLFRSVFSLFFQKRKLALYNF